MNCVVVYCSVLHCILYGTMRWRCALCIDATDSNRRQRHRRSRRHCTATRSVLPLSRPLAVTPHRVHSRSSRRIRLLYSACAPTLHCLCRPALSHTLPTTSPPPPHNLPTTPSQYPHHIPGTGSTCCVSDRALHHQVSAHLTIFAQSPNTAHQSPRTLRTILVYCLVYNHAP